MKSIFISRIDFRRNEKFLLSIKITFRINLFYLFKIIMKITYQCGPMMKGLNNLHEILNLNVIATYVSKNKVIIKLNYNCRICRNGNIKTIIYLFSLDYIN